MRGLIFIMIFVVCAIGWVGNIVKLTQCDFEAPYKCEVIRSTGIVVAPVGVILGYLSIED